MSVRCPCRCCLHTSSQSDDKLRILVHWSKNRKFIVAISKLSHLSLLPNIIKQKARSIYQHDDDDNAEHAEIQFIKLTTPNNPLVNADLDVFSSGAQVGDYLKDYDQLTVEFLGNAPEDEADSNGREELVNERNSNAREAQADASTSGEDGRVLNSVRDASNDLNEKAQEVIESLLDAYSGPSEHENGMIGVIINNDSDDEEELEIRNSPPKHWSAFEQNRETFSEIHHFSEHAADEGNSSDDNIEQKYSPPRTRGQSDRPEQPKIDEVEDQEHEDAQVENGPISPISQHRTRPRRSSFPQTRPTRKFASNSTEVTRGNESTKSPARQSSTISAQKSSANSVETKKNKKRKAAEQPMEDMASPTEKPYSLRHRGQLEPNAKQGRNLDPVQKFVLSHIPQDQRKRYKEASFKQ